MYLLKKNIILHCLAPFSIFASIQIVREIYDLIKQMVDYLIRHFNNL